MTVFCKINLQDCTCITVLSNEESNLNSIINIKGIFYKILCRNIEKKKLLMELWQRK